MKSSSLGSSASFSQASGSSATAAVTPIDPNTLTSDQLFAVVTAGAASSDPTANLKARLKQLGALTFQQFYTAVDKFDTNLPLTFDGSVNIASAKDRLEQDEAKILQLGDLYDTVESFWEAEGIDPDLIQSSDLQEDLFQASGYYNGGEAQPNIITTEQPAQSQVATTNAIDAIGSVSPDQDPDCGQAGHYACTPTPVTVAKPLPGKENLNSCLAPSGLALKHACTVAFAVGGAIFFGDVSYAPVAAVVSSAGLVCVAESMAPTAPACNPADTYDPIIKGVN